MYVFTTPSHGLQINGWQVFAIELVNLLHVGIVIFRGGAHMMLAERHDGSKRASVLANTQERT